MSRPCMQRGIYENVRCIHHCAKISAMALRRPSAQQTVFSSQELGRVAVRYAAA